MARVGVDIIKAPIFFAHLSGKFFPGIQSALEKLDGIIESVNPEYSTKTKSFKIIVEKFKSMLVELDGEVNQSYESSKSNIENNAENVLKEMIAYYTECSTFMNDILNEMWSKMLAVSFN